MHVTDSVSKISEWVQNWWLLFSKFLFFDNILLKKLLQLFWFSYLFCLVKPCEWIILHMVDSFRSRFNSMLTAHLISVSIIPWHCSTSWRIKSELPQVATALLVAGSTPTFWIPQFASTSSYSSVVKALGCLCDCRRRAYGSFQLTHMSRDDHAVQLIEPWRPRRRQNVTTALTTLP